MKLLVSEPGSDHVAAVWRAADSRVSSLLLYPETRAALGRAERMGRLKAGQARAALETLWAAIDRVELGDALAQHAGDLAGQLGLRAYDAVHLASLEFVGSDDIVFLSADRELADAARSLGFAVVEPRP